MNKLFLLYRTLRKSDATKSTNTLEDNEHSIPASLIAGIVFGILLAGGIGYVGYALAGFFDLFGGVSTVLSVLSLITGILIAVKGLVQLINSLYMSTDTGLLITMPVSPVTLAAVRLLNTLVSSFLIMAGVLLSFALGYCFAAPTDFTFWIGICLYIVLIPLFVTLVAAALSVLLMSAFRMLRSRNAMKYFAMFGMLIGVIAYVGWVALSSTDIDISKVIGTAVSFTQKYTNVIPVIPFIRTFMDARSIASVGIALLITAIALVLCILIVKCLYMRSVVRMQDTAASTKRLKGRALERMYEAKEQSASYRRKEMRLLRRNPVYLLKNFIIAFGWPLIIIPPFWITAQNAAPTQSVPEEVATVELVPGIADILILTLGIVCAVIVLLNMFNDIAYSSITREGKMFAVMKQLPLSYREQIRAKRDVARNIVGISTLGYLTVGAVVGAILGVIPWYAIPYGLLVGFPLLYLVVDIDMISGIHNANLHWDNEAIAIKKKAKLVLGSYLLMLLVLAGLVFFYLFLQTHHFLGVPCLLAVPVLLIVAAILVNRHMYTIAEAKLPKL